MSLKVAYYYARFKDGTIYIHSLEGYVAVILFLYHLQNLVGKASHSLDSWVTVLLVYVMKSDDRNLLGFADLFYRFVYLILQL